MEPTNNVERVIREKGFRNKRGNMGTKETCVSKGFFSEGTEKKNAFFQRQWGRENNSSNPEGKET